MNFKEIYKSANDEIHGDRSLIDEVFKKAEKKPVFKIAYPVVCAAAALLIVVTVSLNPKTPVKETPNINIASNKDAEKKDIKPNEKTNVQSDMDRAEFPEKYSEPEKSDVIPATESTLAAEKEIIKQTTEEEQIHETQDFETAEDLSAAMVVMLDINDVQQSAPAPAGYSRKGVSGGAGGGASVESVEFEGMTAQQYYEYIGTNVVQKIELPQDMYFEDFFGTTVKRNSDTQEIISDIAEFYASGENKYLSVSVTKLSGDTANKLNDETLRKSDVMGTPVVIEGYELTYRMYVKYGDVYYNIYSEGLTLEEIENLLISICKI